MSHAHKKLYGKLHYCGHIKGPSDIDKVSPDNKDTTCHYYLIPRHSFLVSFESVPQQRVVHSQEAKLTHTGLTKTGFLYNYAYVCTALRTEKRLFHFE